MTLAEVDLEKIPCPHGLEIEIEGLGTSTVRRNGIHLLAGIAHACSILTGKPIIGLTQDKITLLALGCKKVTARIALAL